MINYTVALFAVFQPILALTSKDFNFLKYITKYGKSYSTMDEFNFRAHLYEETEKAINLINS